jgi:hypothetical protein
VDPVDEIISGIHAEINMAPPTSRIETMSVSDEEITSIIEDATDLSGIVAGSRTTARKGRVGGRKANTARTLDL